MEKIRLFIFLGLLVAVLASCSKKSAPPPQPPPDTVTVKPPGKAVQLTPANNEPCTVGTNVTGTQSKVTFTWTAATATDTYEVHIKNLVTNNITVLLTPNLTLDATLALATPYSWYLVSTSKKSTQTAQSDTWKFYNSGPGITFYPPYPAEAVYPLVGQTLSFPVGAGGGSLTIKWQASAGSSPIKNYTLRYTNLLYNINTTNASIVTTTTNSATVSVSAGNTYYWEVVTTDTAGNTSASQVYNFYVE
ncbi:hypothetical protein [Mucilaginibacter gotjawali]|uniref:Uncharacterized protein n=2 Tax=Mucilaginibacter gotjawali TaxID=1550579 RepID=A0A839SKH3_9SPHI|nr:hypothetical protein [Mucilaginibacter gotjawali]MBB3057754.1 hypothetical protein [Mucilaginibacter gotjawali]BAU52556.1 hypothetical protein MgSA37_00718 [Mucilaginibacter gotjawali]